MGEEKKKHQAPVVYWSIKDIAFELQVSRWTVWAWRRAKTLPPPDELITNRPRWKSSSIRKWIKRRTERDPNY